MEHKEPSKDYEIFMYKNQLQEFTQKSALPLPKYQTFNEGEAHAPRFRSPVLVDGVAYTSPHSFFHQRASEQDVAKIALEILSKKIESENENEGVSFILKDATSCKSILHEYAVKMNLGKPTYTTSRAEGIVPVFTSSSHFNGQTYTGDLAKSKKEAEQLAVHAVIESILANSNTRALMCEIIRSKRKLYATFSKKDSSPRLSSERKVPSRSHTQNDTVIGKIVFVNSTNTKVPEMICSGDEKIAKSTATETFTPEAKKFEEEYTCELSSGTNGNDSSQPTLPLGGSITASNTSNPSEGPLAHVRVNNGEKLIEPSTNRPEDSQDVVLLSGIRRSDTAENGGNKSKKARIIEQYVPSFLPPASKGREPEKKGGTANTTADLESKKRKVIAEDAAPDSVRVCSICDVVCNSDTVFAHHLAGKKHALKCARATIPAPRTIPKTAAKNASKGLIAFVQSSYCDVCKIDCNSQEVLNNHRRGRKHIKNLQKLQEAMKPKPATNPANNSTQIADPSASESKAVNEQVKQNASPAVKEDLETKKQKVLSGGAAADAVRVCTHCNVVCNSDAVYSFHITGKKHAAMMNKQKQPAPLSQVR